MALDTHYTDFFRSLIKPPAAGEAKFNMYNI